MQKQLSAGKYTFVGPEEWILLFLFFLFFPLASEKRSAVKKHTHKNEVAASHLQKSLPSAPAD